MDSSRRHSSENTVFSTAPQQTAPPPPKTGAYSTTRNEKSKGALSQFAHNLLGFFKETWRSISALAIMGAVTGGVWGAPHAFDRLFPVTYFSTSGDIVWTQFAYPYIEPLSPTAAALMAIMIPIGIILIAQIWVRSFCDAANAILGLAYSLVTGTFINVILKKTIGGLRPHFLSVCQPVIPQQAIGKGFQNIMFTIEQVCTGDRKRLHNAIESFPSGHSEIAFAGFFYLSIYLFAHLQIQSRYRVGYWRMVACVLPTLLATYLASTLVLRYQHHGHDVIFGSLLGIVVSLFGYRMVYKSIWDKRRNAVPSCHPDHGEDREILPR